MLLVSSFDVTFGLIVTFGGIGVVVNGLIVHIIVQAMGERAENRRRHGADETTTT